MQITYHTDGAEYIEINDLYSQDELNSIMLELHFLNVSGVFVDPDKSGSAQDKKGKNLKRNKAVHLDAVYAKKDTSMVLRANRKLFSLNYDYSKLSSVFRAIKNSTQDFTMLSYYENADFYKKHFDYSMLTALTYFHYQPKKFTGGELVLTEYGVELEPKHNTTYIFCSMEDHEVKPVVMQKEDCGKGFGRYCMTQFMSME